MNTFLIGAMALWIITFILFLLREQHWQLEKKRWAAVIKDYESYKLGAEHELKSLRDHNSHLQDRMKEHVDMIIGQRHDIVEQLQGLCSQVLRHSQSSFIQELEPLLKSFQTQTQGHLKDQQGDLSKIIMPLNHELTALSTCLKNLENARTSAYSSLNEQVHHLSKGHQKLTHETNKLMMALRAPHVRGCWGEMQLRRVVELAGMTAYCDFQEQASLQTEKKQSLKPDMIIHLPGGRKVIVDAKAPLSHYLEAHAAENTSLYDQKMKDHARILLNHIKALSDKNYWSYSQSTPELTVLFLPGESFLSAALDKDPVLMEKASDFNIILATPITLIALLKTISYGWKQETFSQQSQRILKLTQNLQKSLEIYEKSMTALGRAFKQGNAAYQDALYQFEHNISPIAKDLSNIKNDFTKSQTEEKIS